MATDIPTGARRAISYKVTIEATTEERRIQNPQWVVISEADGKKEMGYAPPLESIVRGSETIFEQTVETLDLAAVIKAINSKPAQPAGRRRRGESKCRRPIRLLAYQVVFCQMFSQRAPK